MNFRRNWNFSKVSIFDKLIRRKVQKFRRFVLPSTEGRPYHHRVTSRDQLIFPSPKSQQFVYYKVSYASTTAPDENPLQ